MRITKYQLPNTAALRTRRGYVPNQALPQRMAHAMAMAMAVIPYNYTDMINPFPDGQLSPIDPISPHGSQPQAPKHPRQRCHSAPDSNNPTPRPSPIHAIHLYRPLYPTISCLPLFRSGTPHPRRRADAVRFCGVVGIYINQYYTDSVHRNKILDLHFGGGFCEH